MYRLALNLLMFLVFPFILGSTYQKLTVEDIEKIKNNTGHYEVIEATTGKKSDSLFYQAGDYEVITHIESVSAIKKALAKEGIDLSKVRIELYYDPIAIRDDLPPRIWNYKPHPNTVSSPWLDVTKTITTLGETRITIRIDATSARLIDDLFSEPEHKNNTSGFLQISSIRQNCFSQISDTYKIEKISREVSKFEEVPNFFNCVPEKLKKPFLSLFESSLPGSYGSLDQPVIDRLNYYCQNTAKEYYSKLYPLLSLKALDILKNELEPPSKWWVEIIESIEQTKRCQV